MSFTTKHTDSGTYARTGRLETAHGIIETPVFMPVGTKATVKTLRPDEVADLNYRIILANTYHLFLKPGLEVIREFGGLHNWMNWKHALLTDSGGFQVFSLADSMKITDDGVTFRSSADGGENHHLTPEKVIEIETVLGADIIMAFDECASPEKGREYMEVAMNRTHKWAERCIKHFEDINSKDQQLFGIIQGGVDADLRKQSALYIQSLPFDGIAIGGLSVGEDKKDMYGMLNVLAPELDTTRAHYLMGVGDPRDIVEAVAHGVDMFDCVLPTRMARTGTALTFGGRVNLRNSEHTLSHEPIEGTCDCYACKNFSRSYIRHLVMEKEILGIELITLHNLAFMSKLMEEIRGEIEQNGYSEYKRKFVENYGM